MGAAVRTKVYVFQKTFDPAGRMLSGSLPGGSSNFGYDGFGRLESIVHPSGTGNFQRDLLDRITQLTWSGATPISEALGYDLAGNIASLERENSSASTIAYDAVNQILSSVGGSAEVRSYTRDLVGNRLQDSVNGAGSFISNFLTSNGLATYSADPNGFGEVVQEVKGGVTKNFTYRADGRISGFQSGSTQVASYYDALGRLAARAINDGTSSYTQSYAYIGMEPTLLQAKAGDGTITSFLSGQGPITYLAESKNGVYKGYVTDHAGSILNSALAGSTHRYGLHGEPTGSATLSPTSDPAMLGWQGLRYNPESGNWDNIRREYNSNLGSFYSQEPTGEDGPHLYWSRFNNPLRFADPDGLSGVGIPFLYQTVPDPVLIVGPGAIPRKRIKIPRTDKDYFEVLAGIRKAGAAMESEFPDACEGGATNRSTKQRFNDLQDQSEKAEDDAIKLLQDMLRPIYRKRNST